MAFLRRVFVMALLLTVAAPCFSHAASHPFGFGAVLGDPTGFTAKYFYSGDKAIDGTLGWTSSKLHLHANHLWHRYQVFDVEGEPIDLYYGVGARILNHEDNDRGRGNDDDETHFGARAPVGLRHMFKDPRIEVFLEVALSMDVTPDTGADLDFGIGGRYYF